MNYPVFLYISKKSRVRETPTLSTDADSSTDTKKTKQKLVEFAVGKHFFSLKKYIYIFKKSYDLNR